jgi:flavin reductase (DIM6/NTAB) family NADH-FMN oxidoreductase RutF
LTERHSPIDVREIDDNVFSMIADRWMLVTAGGPESYNTMTASWGALGELWSAKVAFAFVRPQRHTYGFMNRSERFTLSFFGEEHREALRYCGTHSGRNVDKAAETGLTPFSPVAGTVSFSQAELVLVCRKIYFQDLDPDMFLERWIGEKYPERGYHRMYIGEIEKALRARP